MTDDEIEAKRQKELAETRKSDKERGEKQPLEFRYGPETFGCHEALHVTLLVLGLIERELLSHGTILQNAEWYRHVYKAQDELGALYQEIGAAHLSGTDQRH